MDAIATKGKFVVPMFFSTFPTKQKRSPCCYKHLQRSTCSQSNGREDPTWEAQAGNIVNQYAYSMLGHTQR